MDDNTTFWLELYALLTNVLIGCAAVAIVLGLILVNILFFEALVNFPKKLGLLEQYASEGVEVEGWIVRQYDNPRDVHVQRQRQEEQQVNGNHRANTNENSTTVVAQYAYPIPLHNDNHNTELQIYKPFVRIPECPVPGEALSVVYIPEHPKSGFPKVLVESRRQFLRGWYRYKRIAFCILVYTCGLYLLHYLLKVWYPVTMFLLASLLGYPYSRLTCQKWRNTMLKGVDPTRPYKYSSNKKPSMPRVQEDDDEATAMIQPDTVPLIHRK